MELKYTLDQFAQEPIILIHGDIGYEDGTMGDQLVKELMYLDTLNKPRIQIWINSGGGVVTDGEQMCHAILKSKTPVDTYNTGTCASIAYPIFACGRKRYMMDFAKNMFHNPFGGDEKSLEAFKNTILKIIIQRSSGKLTEEKMSEIMNAETWIMAEESKKLGLCDEIESSGSFNVTEMVQNINRSTSTFKDYSKVLNQMIENKKPKPQNMNKVCNKLNLVEGSNEEAILNAIAKIENQAKFDKAEFEKCKDELAKSEMNYIETKAKFDAMEKDYIETKAKISDAENKAKAVEAKEEVAKAVKAGKVENKAEVIEKMEARYVADPSGTKEILDSIKGTVDSANTDSIDSAKRTEGSLNVQDINNSISKNLKTKRGQL